MITGTGLPKSQGRIPRLILDVTGIAHFTILTGLGGGVLTSDPESEPKELNLPQPDDFQFFGGDYLVLGLLVLSPKRRRVKHQARSRSSLHLRSI